MTDAAPKEMTLRERVGWRIHLLLIGGYFAAAIPLTLAHLHRRTTLGNNSRGLLLVSLVELSLFALVFALGWLASRATPEQLYLIWRPGWFVLPLGVAYSIAIRIGVGIVLLFVIGLLLGSGMVTPESLKHSLAVRNSGIERLVSVSALKRDPLYFWLTITLVSFVVAGLREEMWRSGTLAAMRALWPNTFGSKRGEYFAIGLIAIVFGAAHLPMGVMGACAAGVLGLFLGVIMVAHRSIWPAVIAHGLFDATSFALLPWAFQQLQHFR